MDARMQAVISALREARCGAHLSFEDEARMIMRSLGLTPYGKASGDEYPAGAIHNGRVFFDRIENRGVSVSIAGFDEPIANDPDWCEARRCFEVMAEYIEKMTGLHAEQNARSLRLVLEDFAELCRSYYDDEHGNLFIPVNDVSSCPTCTVGTVPNKWNKGPCAWHRLCRAAGLDEYGQRRGQE